MLQRRPRRSAPAGLQRVRPTPSACSCLMAARNEHACDTHPLFTSPTNFQQTGAVHFPTRTRRLRRRGLAASPPCTPIVVNKKTCRASMICVTILRLVVFLFLHDLIVENARTTALARSRRQMPRDEAETPLLATFWPCFSGETAEAKHLFGEAASRGVRLFDETPHALFEPRRRADVAHHEPRGR